MAVKVALTAWISVTFAARVFADSTWVYAVQLSASVQESPPQITLNWLPDQYGANSYTVFRKMKDDTSWGAPLAVLEGAATGYTDSNVSPGQTYEYQVSKDASLGYKGYGYIFSGIRALPIENRGTIVLVVASNIAAPLGSELAVLQNDLTGDGWQVIRHDVDVSADPSSVRDLIRSDYNAAPTDVNCAFLLGHVPVFYSGNLNYDSHGTRAMAADGFYGDMTGDWSGSPSFFPAEVRLMVGRVDFYAMPGVGALTPWPSETELLRQYLNKDHNWRLKVLTAPRRALMANRIGDIDGIAPAATGYRAFQPLVGAGNTAEANTADAAPATERWISLVTSAPYLWSYGCGGGTDTSVSQLGTHGLYNDVWSTDIVDQHAQAVFTMFDGSHFADWDHTDNLLRSVLATSAYGLTACVAGGPHWYLHHMGLGETIGFSTRLTMNNSTLYQNQSNYLARAIYINLMGDPTLHVEQTAPPARLNTTLLNSTVRLTWSASPDANAGYFVYRSTSPYGPFFRISGDAAVSSTEWSDLPGAGVFTYMVRAIALVQNPSGSCYNLSQGLFTTIAVSGAPPAISVAIAPAPNGILLSWNSQPGLGYHVEMRTASNSDWNNISGNLTASGGTLQWTDTSAFSDSARLYRIASP